jgi:iron complex outermembrane recepter protein
MGSTLARRQRGTPPERLLGAVSIAVVAAAFLAVPAHAQVEVAQANSEGSNDAAAEVTQSGSMAQERAETVANDESTGAAEQTETADAAPAEGQEIVVTGFRRSLNAALNVKRNATAAVDVIVAEDIAKFPDQNLAESLQRIPGISIQREGGEGRTITVRGLGAQFTRVRLNGLETVATSTEGASANRDRAFDFNVFASELFNSIVVHKTAEASLDEGSLGAVVDLNTGNPLAGAQGFTFVASAQASYNDLSKDAGPRLAGLVSWKSPDGDFGVAISAAYQENKTLELGNNTVRWQQARFDSVAGVPCFVTSATNATPRPNSGGVYRPSAQCDAVTLAFHPRIPRYSEVGHDRERLGVTGSVQWSPTEATKVSVDGLFSRFKEDREEKHGEVLFRNNERAIDVVNFEIDPDTNNLVRGTFNDVYVRTEHYLRRSKTDFYQLGASWDQDVSDSVRFTLLGGFSKSDADIPIETSLMFDDRDAQGYSYDYTNSRSPILSFGTSVTDPANFQLAEIRDRPSNVTNKFRTLSLRGEWDAAEGFQLAGGAVYRRFAFDTEGSIRDTLVCPRAGPDVVLGTIACTGTSIGANAVYGFPVNSTLGELWRLGRAGQPRGNTNEFLIPNLAAGTEFTRLYSRTAAPDVGNIRGVVEKVTGGYLETRAKGDLFGLRYAADAGIRYVKTDQSSRGIVNGIQEVTVERSYEDWLPALNLAFYPTEQVIVRGAIAKVITRPSLGNLTPGGSVDSFNFRVSFGNPFLEPFRATAYDLALEWYFAPQSIASVALFKKDVSSFPISVTRTGTFASTGLPLSVLTPGSPAAQNPEAPFVISTIENGTGASLKGVEIQLQAPFRFLPGFLKNFGGIANATFVDSDATYELRGPATNPSTLTLTSVTRQATLFGLSKRAFNGTLYYEDTKFSARASVSYRSKFIEGGSATGNIFEGFNSTINLDASVRYRLTEQLELSLEGINLTDDYRDRFTDIDANRNYEYNHFGRTILVGARFKL